MTDDGVLGQLAISRSGRGYPYRWQGQPPLPPGQIRDHSANMHLIPADDGVAGVLQRIRTGQTIALHGWLVEVDDGRGWRWRSSLTRYNSGGGACELVYVCAVEWL